MEKLRHLVDQTAEKLKTLFQTHKILFLLLIAILGLFLFTGIRALYHSDTRAQLPETNVEVHTKLLEPAPMYKTITLFGQTTALAKINIVNKYPGTINRVDKDLGDIVEAGDILLQQDLKDIELQIARARADYRSYEAYTERYDADFNADYQKAKSEYDLKKLNFDRYSQLYAKGAISKLALDQAEQSMVAAQAGLNYLTGQKKIDGRPAYVAQRAEQAERRRNSMLLLENQLEDMTLRAPRKGIISYRHAEAGSYVQAGTLLFTLVDTDSLHIDCAVGEEDAAFLIPGEKVLVLVEALGKNYEGTIVFISPDKSKETKNYPVRIALDANDKNLKAGMFAKGSLRFLQKDNILFVNRNAIMELNGKHYVFILGTDKKVHRKTVRTGIRNEEEAEIVDGLQTGDTVIVDNITRLREGMDVIDLGKKEEEK